jgi:hypothetical protein
MCMAAVMQVVQRFGVPSLKPFPAAPKSWLMQASAVRSLLCSCNDAGSSRACNHKPLETCSSVLTSVAVLCRPLICSTLSCARHLSGPGERTHAQVRFDA